MRLKVDEKGLGRVLSTLNVGKILIPALAEFMMNIDVPPDTAMSSESSKSLIIDPKYKTLYDKRDSYFAIPVRSASHYMDVLSDVLQGKPFTEEELNEVSILFMNKGVDILVLDGGQQLQKGDINVKHQFFTGHRNWVLLKFHDVSYLNMAIRFFANQRKMSNEFALPDDYSLDKTTFKDEIQDYDEEAVERWLENAMDNSSPAHYDGLVDADAVSYFDTGSLSTEDLQEFRESERILLVNSSSNSVTLSFKDDNVLRMVQICMNSTKPGIGFAPIHKGVAYSSTNGNLFFYEARNVEKELGMVSFNIREGKEIYSSFLKAITDELIKIEREADSRISSIPFHKIVDEIEVKIWSLFGEFSERSYLLFPELRKVTDAKFPIIRAAFRLLNWRQDSKVEARKLRYKNFDSIKGDKTIIIDARYYESNYEGSVSAKYNQGNLGHRLPHIPESEISEGDENDGGRAYLLTLNRQLINVLERSPFVKIYTLVPIAGNISFDDTDSLDEDSIGILTPDDMVMRGEGDFLNIMPSANTYRRMVAKNLVHPSSELRQVKIVKDESSSNVVVKLADLAYSDVIIFRNGLPYKIPYNRMKEYGIKKVTERLDVAIIYEDRALIDPLYSIWKKGLKFPNTNDPVLYSDVEAYDGLFLMWEKVKKND